MISLTGAATEQPRFQNALSINRLHLLGQGLLSRWQVVAALSPLSDHGLRDIGLTRDDLRSIARDTGSIDRIEQTRIRQSRNW
ncbi:DUF1127 domain-containing protein [Ruegeria aquimaris]|uniref:DUF1127 domain-containing protein n=1 Tax=Ruegeria aquimaris TaxID=2984333 RepID=A0ABT3AM78_9RHOB|nr:DUF1127 domain-containing protein [Ruegeria sp. XHP0148]MCV2889763.1 DUF1127 domain-containing protein [Ruegeria sp. XHP0148]